MEIIGSVKEMQMLSDRWRREGLRIGLVPTMGYLHEGHLSLMRRARKETDRVIATIFVNPTQFVAGEDYERYPVDRESDMKKTEQAGIDILFCPDVKEIYPEGYDTYVHVEKITERLCGKSRPGHFRGVTTVVAKLFHICKPHRAYFGKKDFQQLTVIKKMVDDLNMDIEIVGMPTVREKDGLAMSSRNEYLDKEERKAALCLSRSLRRAEEMVRNGEVSSARIAAEMKAIIDAEKGTDIDYIEICDPKNFDHVDAVDKPVLIALAVKIGRARLIDNCLVSP